MIVDLVIVMVLIGIVIAGAWTAVSAIRNGPQRTESKERALLLEATQLAMEIKAQDDLMPLLPQPVRDDLRNFLLNYHHFTTKRGTP